MDTIGKESLLNASLEKFQETARSNPNKLKTDITHIFEDETDSVISDLKEKKITDNVKLLVYSRLLDFQPAALSEMPEQYLKAGNGRLFYMLKSYSLKQFDVYRREVYNNLKNGTKADKIQAMKNLAYLSMLIVLANAGADELKDFVLGRETTFSDRVIDNILRLFGVSKYVTWKARTEGLGSAMVKQILPPFKFIDSISKDVATAGDGKGLETLGSIPVIGKLAYWHIGRGIHKRGDLWGDRLLAEKRKLSDIKERVEADRTLRGKYSKELGRLRRVNALQGRLNQKTKIINHLKALEKQSGIDYNDRIKKLEDSRSDMIEAFFTTS